jgi:predicted site-specific integrase-resolvase
MQKQFPNCTIVSDIGSGINWKRKGFISILEQSMQGNIKKIIIAHRDRLCRFAFEFVEWLFNKYGVELMVLNKEDKNTTKNELAEDLLSIIHIFSCRENGKRRYSRKN